MIATSLRPKIALNQMTNFSYFHHDLECSKKFLIEEAFVYFPSKTALFFSLGISLIPVKSFIALAVLCRDEENALRTKREDLRCTGSGFFQRSSQPLLLASWTAGQCLGTQFKYAPIGFSYSSCDFKHPGEWYWTVPIDSWTVYRLCYKGFTRICTFGAIPTLVHPCIILENGHFIVPR